MEKGNLNLVINKSSLFIYKNRIINLFSILINLVLIVLFILINYLQMMTSETNFLTILKTDLASNSALMEQTSEFFDFSFHSMEASHFYYLTLILVLILFLFIRLAPRKTGLVYLFLSVRTFLELLISIQDVKNNTIHLWYTWSPYDGAHNHSVAINPGFLLVMLLLCFSLLIQGLILLIPNSKLFKTDFNLLKYKNQKQKYWVENIIILVPIVIFSTSIGNFLLSAPFFANGIPTINNSPAFYLFILLSTFINSILFYIFHTIEEPHMSRVDGEDDLNRKYIPFYILFNTVWFLLLCFYGIMFWDIQKHVTLKGLIVLIPFTISLILGFIFSYILFTKTKYKPDNASNSETTNTINSSKRKIKNLKKALSVLILISILFSPLVCVNLITSKNIYPNDIGYTNGFGLDMMIERSLYIQNISINSSGFFNMEIQVDYNFSNVIEEGKAILVIADGFVVDSNFDSYYDVFTLFSNLSASILTESGNFSIYTYDLLSFDSHFR